MLFRLIHRLVSCRWPRRIVRQPWRSRRPNWSLQDGASQAGNRHKPRLARADEDRGNRNISSRPDLRTIFLVVLATAAFAFGARQFVMPHAASAKTYPAHDGHQDEKVTIAVDPYDRAQKTSIFHARYLEHGLLPMLFIVSNEGGESLALNGMKVRLVLTNRTKISPANEDDLYRRLSRTPNEDSPVSRLPVPQGPKTGVSKEIQDELEAAGFRANTVGPAQTQSGFFFFDVSGMKSPIPGAHLYVSGVRDSSGKELFYFDIPLDKYLATTLPPPN